MNQEIVTKKCPKCEVVKPVSEFSKNNKQIDKLFYYCKECERKRSIIYRTKNSQKLQKYIKKWRKNNKDKTSKQHEHWKLKNKIKFYEYGRKYREKHKDYIINYKKKYNKIRRIKRKIRWETDPCFKLIENTRNQINKKLNSKKSDHTINYIGLSNDKYKKIIETLFYKNMNWKLHGNGRGKWQIHHICPLEFINWDDPVEVKQALHYTNTKPLWYEDHVEEHRKINERMKQYGY